MNYNEIFKVDLKSLGHLSSIAVAINLWERPDVKEKINDGNSFHGTRNLTYDPNNTAEKDHRLITPAQKIVNYLFEQTLALNLPETVLPGVKILIVKIGQKILYWRQYVTGVLKLNSVYAEKIYWTCYGEIDELKILQEFWLKDLRLPGIQCKCFLNNSLYCLAAAYGQEDFMRSRFEDIKGCIFSYIPAWCRRQYDWTPDGVIATWMLFCKIQKKTPAVRAFKNLISLDSISIRDLFLKCLGNRNEFGVKYYWNRLNVNEKNDLLGQAASSCLNFRTYDGFAYGRYYSQNLTTVKSYTKEKCIKLLLFFIDKMTELQRMEFMCQNFVILFKLFFQVWPYQEFCHKFLIQMWDHVPGHQKEIFTFIINKLICRGLDSPDYFTMKNFYRKMIQNLLGKISKELKVSILISSNYKIFHDLYKIFDNDTLNLLINDADLKDHKSEILKIGNKYFKDFLLKGDHKSINKFMRNMEFSAEEIKTFKRNFNLFNGFLMSGDLALAEEHLNWLCDTDEERKKLKSSVNADDIYFILVQNFKFETADKFLLWRFDTEEEREKVKRPLKSEEFVLNKIFEIWGGKNAIINPEPCADNCSELLKWYSKSEQEATEFKKSKIIQDEYFIEKYWNSLYAKKTLVNLDKFLKFCMMSPEEIQIMKIKVASNINWWIDNFALEKDLFPMVQAILDWVYADDQNGKKTIIKNYMSSPRGSLLCLRVFKNCSEKSPSPIVKFFNTWIEPSFNYSEFDMQLEKCNQAHFGHEVISCVKSLLKLREQNQTVRAWHLHGYISFENSNIGSHYDGYEYYHEGDGYYDDDDYDYVNDYGPY